LRKNKKSISFSDKNVLKTMGISVLSLLSIPFLSYFLTKHALLSMPYIGSILSLFSVQCIAICSSVTALVTSFITTIPATYDYFVAREKRIIDKQSTADMLTGGWRTLRNTTYAAGFIDCTANGLTNFMSVIDVAHDAISVDPYGNIMILAVGCGISSALLTAAFSVRQGFNDFMNDFQHDKHAQIDLPANLVKLLL